MKKKIPTFYSKFFKAIIVLIVIVMSAIFAIFSLKQNEVRHDIENSFYEMKTEVNKISTDALNRNYNTMMNYIVSSQRSSLEYAMSVFDLNLSYLSHIIEDYYKKNVKIKNSLKPPNPKDDGKITAQLMCEPNVDLNSNEIQEELKILSNVSSELVLEVKDSIEVYRCYILTQSGIIVMADNAPSDKYDENGNLKTIIFRGRDWYENITQPNVMVVLDAIQDSLTDKEIITLCKPFHDTNGIKKGIVCYELFVDEVSVKSFALKDSNVYDILISDSKNNIFINTRENKSEDNDEFEEKIKSFLDSKNNINEGSSFFECSGIKYKLYYSKFDFADWKLIVALNYNYVQNNISNYEKILNKTNENVYDNINNSNKSFLRTFIVFTIILLIIIFVFARFIANMLTVPLNNFSKIISETEAENIDNIPIDNSSSELYKLSTTYNNMLIKLKTYVNNIKKITKERESINAELNVAKKIQQDMLPKAFKHLYNRRDIDIYGINIPEVEIGGDFYNYILIGNKLIMIIADVSGSGIPASLFMAKTNSLIKSIATFTTDPRIILLYVNSELCKNNSENYFVTISIYTIDLKTRKVVSANAGHEDSIIIRNNGMVEIFREKRSAPLGVIDNLKIEENEFALNYGDTLFLYTDGAVEGINTEEKLYGEKRLINVVEKNKNKTPEELVLAVKNNIDEFAKGMEQYDDITMLAIKIIDRDIIYNNNLVFNYEKEFNGRYEVIDDIYDFLCTNLSYVYGENNEKYKPYLNKFLVCIEEIVVNIIDYAYEAKDEKYIKISLTIDKNDDKVMISFIDKGKRFDPTLVDEPNIFKDARSRKIAGLGIHITRKFMDVIDYEFIDDKNKFTITKYL